jgi:TRAP-type C4-dicarboxylate transport system substrate-binding protein
VWNSLTEEQQGWLQAAVDESVQYQKALWQKATEEALEEIQKAGVEIIYPDKEQFLLAVQSMHESYRGTPLYDLIHNIRAVQ